MPAEGNAWHPWRSDAGCTWLVCNLGLPPGEEHLPLRLSIHTRPLRKQGKRSLNPLLLLLSPYFKKQVFDGPSAKSSGKMPIDLFWGEKSADPFCPA